jgi:endonuclease YncB( thermonuclease family)
VATVVFAAALAPAARGERFFDARVVAVLDGDTIEVVVGRERRRIRLAGIDTPERGQPWAERAKRALSERVFGREVRVNAVDTDRYGRTVGEVYAENVCVACELVRAGHAWVYRKFSDDPVLLALEAEARAARRGLWALPEAERAPPWEWRRAHAPDLDPPSRSFVCGAGRRCSELATCAEARFQLERCGATELDGDGDGVPCEALCRR